MRDTLDGWHQAGNREKPSERQVRRKKGVHLGLIVFR